MTLKDHLRQHSGKSSLRTPPSSPSPKPAPGGESSISYDEEIKKLRKEFEEKKKKKKKKKKKNGLLTDYIRGKNCPLKK